MASSSSSRQEAYLHKLIPQVGAFIDLDTSDDIPVHYVNGVPILTPPSVRSRRRSAPPSRSTKRVIPARVNKSKGGKVVLDLIESDHEEKKKGQDSSAPPSPRALVPPPSAYPKASQRALDLHLSPEDDISFSAATMDYSNQEASVPAAPAYFPNEPTPLDPNLDQDYMDLILVDEKGVEGPLSSPPTPVKGMRTAPRTRLGADSLLQELGFTFGSQSTDSWMDRTDPIVQPVAEPTEPVSSAKKNLASFFEEVVAAGSTAPLLPVPAPAPEPVVIAPLPEPAPAPEPVFEPAKVLRADPEAEMAQPEKPRGQALNTDEKRKKRGARDALLTDALQKAFTPSSSQQRQRKPPKRL